MCEIKSFEELMDKYDMEGALMHVRECRQCNERYASMLSVLCPEINTAKMQAKTRRIPYLLRKFAWIGALGLLLFIFYPRQNTAVQPALNEYAYVLEYNDYIDLVDNMDDDEFWALYEKLEVDE